MADQFSQVRHYLAIAEEAIAEREERDKETIAEQAKYITQLERDTLELETMGKLLAGMVAQFCPSSDPPLRAAIHWIQWAEREAQK